MVQHADIDHTGITGVGGGGGEFTESSTAEVTGGDITTTSTTFADATGLSVTITTAAVRCLVIFSASVGNNTASRRCDVDLAIDGTRQGQTNGLIFTNNTDANELHNGSFTFLTDVLSAASHTFKIQFKSGNGAGTATIFASAANTPAILTVLETSMTS